MYPIRAIEMDEKGGLCLALRIINDKNRGVYIDAETADRLCAIRNPDALRLYLCVAVHGDAGETAARRLRMSPEALHAAEQELINARLASSDACEDGEDRLAEMKRQSRSEPGYTAAEVTALVTSDTAFAQIVREAEKVLNPCLNESDLRELMTIYRFFGMPAECVILLLHFTAARAARQGGRRPSLAAVKREALRWLENGVVTPEAAERFVCEENRLYDVVERMEKAAGLQAYKSDERRLLRSWAEMGFDGDAVALAREITVKRLGEMQLKYAGSILKSWKDARLTDAAAIAAYEAKREQEHAEAKLAYDKRAGRKRAPAASGGFSAAERSAIQEIQKYMENNTGS